MALSTASVAIIPAGTAIAPGGTEDNPVAAGAPAAVGPFTDYGDTVAYRITNGAAGPGIGLTLVAYGVDGGRMYPFGRVTLSATANDTTSGSFAAPPGYSSFTVRAFGNTANPVTVEAYLQRQIP